jgi:hypothetical protein
MNAVWAFRDNKSDEHRRVWQKAMYDLLTTYARTSKPRKFNPGIPLDWMPLADLSSAMGSVIEGKDTDLFFVDPTDRYDSSMIFTKKIAVGYVAKAKNGVETQKRKKEVIDWYGISRSTLNEWIRAVPPHDYDEELDGPVLSDCIDHYRNNKLTGRRRRS